MVSNCSMVFFVQRCIFAKYLYLKSILNYFFLIYFYLRNFLKKYLYLNLYLLIEKTSTLNTNKFYFKELSFYDVYFSTSYNFTWCFNVFKVGYCISKKIAHMQLKVACCFFNQNCNFFLNNFFLNTNKLKKKILINLNLYFLIFVYELHINEHKISLN